MSSTPEDAAARHYSSTAAVTTSPTNHRSYICYSCNFSFHITPATTSSSSSPSSFRCPRCLHRHILPHHTISPPQQTPPSQLSPPINSDHTPVTTTFSYYTSDDSDSEHDYDSDNSLRSFTTPTFHPSTPALKSFVNSLPIKTLIPNPAKSLQSCSICMEDFEIHSNSCAIVNELPCQHYFHNSCIVEWLNRSYTCPLCRFKLPVEPGPIRWEDEYDAVLVVDMALIREPMTRRLSGTRSLGSGAEAAESNWERMGLNFDAMHDEDGDTLMVDV
ncbi:uncharacterized protein LOC142543635 [Primulina tabacum]|uniref:uncharacterized protein LOC142543635 n=1 Tax=Primulina tabacum TaxID=48773 RepID=UPI003F59431D